MSELVTVIIPVYNTVGYLSPCLESVCNQTYSNLEIILIDDGSTDGSGALCDEWAEKDNRIKVIHQDNAGVSAARNAGLAACTGYYITFVDSDDWIDLRMMEKLHQCLVENGADAAMCGFVDYNNDGFTEKGVFSAPLSDYQGTVYQMMRRNGYFTSLWAKMFRWELIIRDKKAHPFDLSLSFGEDEVWLLEVLSGCGFVAFLPQALYYWRPREGSITRSERITERQLSVLNAKKKTLALLPNNPSLKRLARGRIYNDCHYLKTQAYLTNNTEAMRRVSEAIRPMWKDWLLSGDVRLFRKVKLMLLEAEMFFQFPKDIVKKTNEKRTIFHQNNREDKNNND